MRKIAEHAPGPGIEFFREQAHVVAAREQTGEKAARFAIAILQQVIVDEPEAARQESAFAGGQTVGRVLGFVAQDEFAVDQESLLDRAKRSANPRILGRKKADRRETGRW